MIGRTSNMVLGPLLITSKTRLAHLVVASLQSQSINEIEMKLFLFKITCESSIRLEMFNDVSIVCNITFVTIWQSVSITIFVEIIFSAT